MAFAHGILPITLVLALSITTHAGPNRSTQLVRNPLLLINPQFRELQVLVRPDVRKCQALMKKSKKSFSEQLYLKFRCKGVKLPKPKVTKIKTIKPKIVKPRITKPKIMKPRITKPKITKPKITKPKITKPKIKKPKITKPKITKPKIKKPKIIKPKITKPKITKPRITKPKIIKPKIIKPRITKPRITKPRITKPKIVKPKITKPRIVKPRIIKPKIIKPKIVKPEITKPRIVKPRIIKPKITKPRIIKPKITKPKIVKPKAVKPKITKPKIPSIPKKLPKTVPRVVPKVPNLRKKHSTPTPRRSDRRKASPTPSRSPRPSPSSSPSPRPSHSPSPSLKRSLESTKQRLEANIQKQELRKSKRVCKTEEYVCGKRCTGETGRPFACNYENNVPRVCSRKRLVKAFCNGEEGEVCERFVMEPDICYRDITISRGCPGSEEGCLWQEVPVGRCLPKKDCERYSKTKCEYVKHTTEQPCTTPEMECRDCVSGHSVATCPTTAIQRHPTPCPGAEAALPGVEGEMQGTGLESVYVRDVMCFESFFDEAYCEKASRVCRLFDEIFDRNVCMNFVCHACKELVNMIISDEVRTICKQMLEGFCAVTGYDSNVEDRQQTPAEGSCWGTAEVTKDVPCVHALPSNETCTKGCIVQKCQGTTRSPKSYCSKHLPAHCEGQNVCKRDTKRFMACATGRMCHYRMKKAYVCFRERREQFPCAGGCDQIMQERFVCGSSARFGRAVCRRVHGRCRPVYCTRLVCY